jgi:hypothetical protein
MDRRRFLAGAGAAAATGLAGCGSLFETRSARVPPLVEDRPDAVYVPTHVEGMDMVGTATAGDFGVALTYSYPHRFWRVTGADASQVEVGAEDSVHLMATVWDDETGVVVPSRNVSATVSGGDVDGDETRMWAMLSQNMSVHAGDNVTLDGDGTYEVDVEVRTVEARGTGAFADRLTGGETATFSMEFARSTLDELSYERLADREGEAGAVEPMGMDMVPTATVPAAAEFPGTVLGEGERGDARFLAARLAEPPAGVDGDGPYLAVSARTPYNGYPLPFMGLSATVDRDGETVFDGRLEPSLDPSLGYHYGAVADVESGDELRLSVDTPPQVARHEGYETAFFDTGELSIEA